MSGKGFKKTTIDESLAKFLENMATPPADENIINDETTDSEVIEEVIHEKVLKSKKTAAPKRKVKDDKTEGVGGDITGMLIKMSNFKKLKFRAINSSTTLKDLILNIFESYQKEKLDIADMIQYINDTKKESGKLVNIPKELNKKILLRALKLDVTGNGYMNYIVHLSLSK
jgi:hypothetical protein